jgi:hypothetical protein
VAATYPLVNRTPLRAIESMFGVRMSVEPWKPYSAQPTSSDRKTITFGFAAAPRVGVASAAPESEGKAPEARRAMMKRRCVT